MREIKFRGKRIDYGFWAYGDRHTFYHHDGTPNGYAIFIDHAPFNYDSVIPETIGQYTGLHDRNGKEIYEGDILRIGSTSMLRERNITAEVYWDELGMWATRKNEASRNPIGFAIELGCEVIGNIHDNPELLKGGEE